MELDLMGQLEKNPPAPTSMISPPVDVKLELSLGLSFGEEESMKRAREIDEVVAEKKPKMEEGLVKPAIFPRPISCCYACLISDLVPISMEDFGNNVYENESLALKADGVAEGDLKVEVVDESSSSESGNSGASVLQLFC